MNRIEQYNQARKEIETPFMGLPHVHTTLIKSLISQANPRNGMVENISYRDLATLLVVKLAPGRQGAGIPKKETIRSYLRTIAENCPADFKLISEKQQLRCQFIGLPEIHSCYFSQEQYTGQNQEENNSYELENKEKK